MRPLAIVRTAARLAVPGALALAACSSHEPAGVPVDGRTPRVVERTAGAGLTQTVTLRTPVVRRGEDLVLESVVANHGGAPVAATTRICGLDLEGASLGVDTWAHCAGYSQGGTLDAGATRRESAHLVVTAAPGRYTLRVRHLLDPEVWMAVGVQVR